MSKPTYEDLEAQIKHLAAENAGLKAGASCLVSEYMMNKGTDSEFIACITPSKKTIGTGGAWDMWRYLEMALNTTPATDAILAEVQAQGVDMYAEHLTRKAIESGENKNHAYAYLAANFAAQLRKGLPE